MNKLGVKVFVNALTVFRCIFTFAMPFLVDRVVDAAFIVMVAVLYFTDWIDGFVSRKCGVQTLFGSIMDTVADKVLCIILVVCIPNKHWTLYAMMIGEILIAVMNLLRNVKWCNHSSNNGWKSEDVGFSYSNNFRIYALF
ncbi:MAG: CDP-alcohol phosphatidyltransferase family protein [Clostridia bacterium]|nr:CDP-alcohol phosphatidyltransferase family protein [Clostridia bacterium]